MNVNFIKSPEKKKIVEELGNQFGISEVSYLLLETGKEKIRGFSGSLTKEELIDLSHDINIELLGTYIIKREHDLRLSFDAAHLFKSQITKNIFEITDEQFELWRRGHDLIMSEEVKKPGFLLPKGTLVISYKGDFLGCGKSNGDKISNYIPKERRIRTQLKNSNSFLN